MPCSPSFFRRWTSNGEIRADLSQISQHHVSFFQQLPAIMHAASVSFAFHFDDRIHFTRTIRYCSQIQCYPIFIVPRIRNERVGSAIEYCSAQEQTVSIDYCETIRKLGGSCCTTFMIKWLDMCDDVDNEHKTICSPLYFSRWQGTQI